MRSINFKFRKNRQITKKKDTVYIRNTHFYKKSQQRFHLDFPHQIEKD